MLVSGVQSMTQTIFFRNTANYTEYDLFHVLLHYELKTRYSDERKVSRVNRKLGKLL